MRWAIVLVLAVALIGCGKKADDNKTAPQQESKQEQMQNSAQDTLSASRPDTARKLDRTNLPAPGQIADANPIKNKRWKLVRLNGQRVEVSSDFRSDPYISFSAMTDKMTGSGGCNRFGCKYKLDGPKISFNGFASTKVLCQNAMEIEKPFLQGLTTVDGYSLEGEDKLWLTEGGKRVMEFEAVYLN
ncbi:MAG: META domain-containing protein [Calditrichaeota bacterium]|nr:META domain-containing protein [Calditrichota bacterium]MCB9369500.1 META domain-containing protein [Calditrichota bacterium]